MDSSHFQNNYNNNGCLPPPHRVSLDTLVSSQSLLQSLAQAYLCLFNTVRDYTWFILQLCRADNYYGFGGEHIIWCDQISEQGQCAQTLGQEDFTLTPLATMTFLSNPWPGWLCIQTFGQVWLSFQTIGQDGFPLKLLARITLRSNLCSGWLSAQTIC